MTLDPVIAWTVRASLAAIFLSAAWHKWSNRERFESTVRAYALLDPRVVPAVARLLPWAEAATALCFLNGASQRIAVLVSGAVLATYTLAIAINLARGRRHIDCGCFASASEVPLSTGLLVRNLTLMAASFTLLLHTRPRPLSWLDGMTIGAALLTVWALWSAAQRLAQTGPALRKLEGAR
jgi:uncharacterized membrane protein YphA (DoxX/SURF4 family)